MAAVIYSVLSGTRYATTAQHGTHSTLDAARLEAIALTVGDEQDPPAAGAVASWIDADLNYVCIKAIEVI